MNNQKVILESLAMDLKRVSLGLQRGSMTMAKRFAQESLKRKQEVNLNEVDTYIRKLLNSLEETMLNLDSKSAEDALMYSTLFQNYARTMSLNFLGKFESLPPSIVLDRPAQ